MHPAEADEWNTVMVSRGHAGSFLLLLMVMRGIAPPFGALQDVSVVSWPGVEGAISKLSPVERETHTRVHLMVWRI